MLLIVGGCCMLKLTLDVITTPGAGSDHCPRVRTAWEVFLVIGATNRCRAPHLGRRAPHILVPPPVTQCVQKIVNIDFGVRKFAH